jgi:hypothetical protein
MTAAPECIREVKTDPLTARVTWVTVCAWCEKENKETPRLGFWCEEMGVDSTRVSHGICPGHAARMLSGL